MTSIILTVAVVVAAGASVVFQAEGRQLQPTQPTRIAAVVGEQDVDRAAAALERRPGVEGDVRVARTPTEQLAVTHLLAAKGYDAIVGVDLDRAIAVAPVTARYPATHITSVAPGELDAAVAAAR